MTVGPKSTRAGALAIAVSSLLAGCQLLFGDFNFEPTQTANASGGKGGAAGSSGKANDCGSGSAFRCNGAMLEQCVNKTWTQQNNCSDAERCDASRGQCLECTPNAFRCTASLLEQCDANGQNWSRKDTCINEAYCDAPHGRCATCQPDEAFCLGAQLHVCNAERTDWDTTPCANPDLCSTTSRTCRPCVPGKEYQCNQSKLQRCNDNAQWVDVATCGSSDLCLDSLNTKAIVEASGDTWDGQCNAPLCKAGANRCDPNNPAQVQNCPTSRNRWENVGTPCYTAQLCNASTGKCDSGCQPGVYRCDGAKLMQCATTGTTSNLIMTCPSASQCNVANKTCMDCVAGTYQCADARLQRCNPDQTWETVNVCSTAELCTQTLVNSRTVCDIPGCSPGNSYQCGGTQKKTLQYCPPSQLGWTVVAECATPGLCENGRNTCVNPICDYAGQSDCPSGSNIYRVCDQDRKNWVTQATCSTGQICVKDKGCQGQCPVPNPTCNGGKQIQICSVDPTTQQPRWVQGTTCPSAALCVDGSTQCAVAVCKANEFDCRSADGKASGGNSLFKCSTGLDKWEFVKTCGTNQICDKNGGQCDVCTAGTFSCKASILSQCAADGQTFLSPPTSCLKDSYCYASADAKEGYCYVCDAGTTQCSGTDQIQSCDVGRRSWTTATDCTQGHGCHTTADKTDYCNACLTTQIQCVPATGGAIARTYKPCRDDQKDWSTTEEACTGGLDCVKTAVAGGDYCAACPTAGEVQCVDQSVPGSTQTCSSDRKAWTPKPCTEKLGCIVASGDDYCASSCVANSTECVSGTNGVRQCKPDGSGWGSPKYECYDDTHPKACSDGALSGSAAQCPLDNPACYEGTCAVCNDATSPSCTVMGGRDYRQYCSAGLFVYQQCEGNCANGICIPCTDSTEVSCSPYNAEERRQCSGGIWSWNFPKCVAPQAICTAGNCVECLADGTGCSGSATCRNGVCETADAGVGGSGGDGGGGDGGGG